MSSGIFSANVAGKFHDGGDAISSDSVNEPEWNLGGNAKLGYITTDIYTTFTILVGIFFPSCTGRGLGESSHGKHHSSYLNNCYNRGPISRY